jgi:glycine/D-amino acid oxidase-like deaminating enzyme
MADEETYGVSWYAARMVDAPVRGPLSLELDVDVCVIGGGLAGLSIALEVARRGWSVAVLEARRLAWNASGRNAGVVLPGFAIDPRALVEKVGLDHARTLWALSEAGANSVRQTIQDTGMPGVEIEQNGWLHVSKIGADAKLAADASFLNGEFGMAAEVWPVERVRTQLRSTRYFGGLYLPGAFSINPLNYALGLAAAAEAAGARIFEETPALDIDPAGVRKRITTPSARMRAGHVVLAGNIHIGALMPDLAATLMPISAYSIVTEPLDRRLHEAIRFGGAVSDSQIENSCHRIVDGDRLLWSNRSTVWQGNPRRYASRLVAEIHQTYPQLGPVRAEYAWTGTFGVTVHRMPQLGEVSPGVWLLSGFGGQGINTTAMGAKVVADAIVDNSRDWQLFQPFDLVWAGGAYARAAVQAYYWYSRARERIEAWLAQRGQSVELPPIAPDPPPQSEPDVTAAPSAKRRRRRRKAKPPAEPSADSPATAG